MGEWTLSGPFFVFGLLWTLLFVLEHAVFFFSCAWLFSLSDRCCSRTWQAWCFIWKKRPSWLNKVKKWLTKEPCWSYKRDCIRGNHITLNYNGALSCNIISSVMKLWSFLMFAMTSFLWDPHNCKSKLQGSISSGLDIKSNVISKVNIESRVACAVPNLYLLHLKQTTTQTKSFNLI